MPIYEYRCPKCNNPREIVLPVEGRDESQLCICGEVMIRSFSLPKIIVRQTGKGRALDSLNSKETSHMKAQQKQWAAEGLKEPPKVFF